MRRRPPPTPIRFGILWKFCAALILAVALAIAFVVSQQTDETVAAQDFDRKYAREAAEPYLKPYGIQSLKNLGTTEREEGGLVFKGVGIDKQGKSKRVAVHFRSIMQDGEVQIGIAAIEIDGREVFRSRQR